MVSVTFLLFFNTLFTQHVAVDYHRPSCDVSPVLQWFVVIYKREKGLFSVFYQDISLYLFAYFIIN